MKTLDVDYRGYGLAVEECSTGWRVTILPTRVEQMACGFPTIENADRQVAIQDAHAVIDAVADNVTFRPVRG